MSRQYHLPLPHREAMAAEDFLVTDSNREAWLWLARKSPADWPNHCLILHGPEGCGKTHLLRIWQQRHAARQLALGDDALEAVVNAPDAFPAIAIDDAQQAAGNAAQEAWLQHLFNATRVADIPLLLTARLPPAAWGLQLADIRSRLCAAMSAGLLEPDDDLLTGLLMKQFEDRQLRVESEVIDYLLRHMDRSAAAAARLIERIDRQALEQRRKITVPLAREVVEADVQYTLNAAPD